MNQFPLTDISMNVVQYINWSCNVNFSEGKTPEEAMADLPADLLADITDMLEEEEEEEEFEDEEEEYQFSRVVEDVNDELLNELLDVYDNFNKMPYEE